MAAADAEEKIQALLVDLRLTGWKISRGVGIVTDECVSAGIDTVHGVIRLESALNPAVGDALDVVAEELLDQCLSKEDATAMVVSVLRRFSDTNWEIQTGGLVGGPLDRLDEIKRHAEAGCFVYSGTGMTADGTRIYYVGGLDPSAMPSPVGP